MNDARKSDKAAEPLAFFAQAMSQSGAEAANQFWGRTQSIGSVLIDLNAEAMRFMGHRINQNSEALGRIVQCRSLHEIVDAELQWFRGAFDDYSGYGKKIAEFNGNVVGCVSRNPEPSEQATPFATAPSKFKQMPQSAL